MAELPLWVLLGLIYDLEQTRSFRQLRRELERYYRRQNAKGYRRDAYVDSMLTLLLEQNYGLEQLTARQ
ncbi:MAG: hypothetical protein GX033_07040 [Firmicutes bacterium]|nr:hypothetical protein [Bacillota bacterium]